MDVPLGTIVRDEETGKILAELTEDGEQKILFEGGMGGLGNVHFKTSTKQAPEYSQPGEMGKEAWVIFELKVLADVGLVGFPNAGKSTLLSVVSAAKPEIADYPFTTLTPNLGVVGYKDYKTFVMADIPGIIEGASEGKGLGFRFLRHIERNSVLLFVISAEAENLKKEYEVLLNELIEYNPELLDKKRILGISKIDVLDKKELNKKIKKLPKDLDIIPFSAVTNDGIDQLKDIIWKNLDRQN